MTTPAESRPGGKRALFNDFVAALDGQGIAYCILAGFESYPDVIPSDVDFMVLPEDLVRLPPLVADLGRRHGARLVQALRHEIDATWFALARQDGGGIEFFHPDATGDYRIAGRLWLRARDVLARRRRHPNGFFIPAARDAFIYYLIKKIVDKEELTDTHGEYLSRCYGEDPEGCRADLAIRVGPGTADFLIRAAEANAWQPLRERIAAVRGEFLAKAPAQTLADRLRKAFRLTQRILHPTGVWVAFLGPDGSGKSSVILPVREGLAEAFRRTHYQHLKPSFRKGAEGQAAVVTDPHGKPSRGLPGSLAKLLHFWSAYVIGVPVLIRPLLMRSTFVIFDRYYHDLEADPRRYRYGGPLWLVRMLGRWLPSPDLVFVLDAPAEVVQARKAEVSLAEGRRQREAYARVADHIERACLIDVSRPLAEVVTDVREHVLATMEQRTARRLGLPAPGRVGVFVAAAGSGGDH